MTEHGLGKNKQEKSKEKDLIRQMRQKSKELGDLDLCLQELQLRKQIKKEKKPKKQSFVFAE